MTERKTRVIALAPLTRFTPGPLMSLRCCTCHLTYSTIQLIIVKYNLEWIAFAQSHRHQVSTYYTEVTITIGDA